jgi:ubiquinone/menaquinone biosynthesis C-methylase UbiE
VGKKAKCGFFGYIFRLLEYNVPEKSRSKLYRILYQYLATKGKEEGLLFWNFGFADTSREGKKLVSNGSDEKYRYCIQLYDHVASVINLEGKDILEVSCGCGGGSYFIMKHHRPSSVMGIDFSGNAINFCNSYYSTPALSFFCGNAESLPFENNTFDVVINIESSHCYGNLEHFLKEVKRVLHPNGYFLIADFRHKDKIYPLYVRLKRSGLKFIREEVITPNVLKALELDHERKVTLIQQKAPRFLHNSLKYWWGTVDSKRYELFKSGEEIYFSYVLQKSSNIEKNPQKH